MKIIYKSKPVDKDSAIKVGDILRYKDLSYSRELYMVACLKYGYSLVSLSTGQSYTGKVHDILTEAFGSGLNRFEKVTEPISVVVG